MEDAVDADVDIAARAFPHELSSHAPTIGAVRPLPPATLGESLVPRVSSVELDGLSAGPFDVAAASVVGTGHAIQGGSRQDAYALGVGASGTLYIAVADGLGSRPMSQIGARLLTEAAIAGALEHEPAGAEGVAALVIDAGERAAQIAERSFAFDARSIACVCAVAAIRPDGITVARVGDVSAFALTGDGFAELFSAGEGFINHVAASLPGGSRADIEAFASDDLPLAFALLSDGVANDLRSSPGLRAWLEDRWSQPLGPFAMGDTLRYRRQGSHDDRTAVVVWPRPPMETPDPCTMQDIVPLSEPAAGGEH